MAKAFELGIVMAGAVSAGAYSAGVMDFLIEALDAYYEARTSPDWDGPRHDVRIPIMTGASAGGMTGAIAALHAFRDLQHVQAAAAPPPPQLNRLYSSWVKDIGLGRLLETADVAPPRRQNGVLSALCCDVLDEIVDNAFVIDGAMRKRDWIGREDDPVLRVRLTLTNTRGVPYSFALFGAEAAERFGMLNHADFYEFAVGDRDDLQRTLLQGATALDAAHFDTPDWSALKAAALATGAFPIGLKPRVINRPDTSFYRENGCVGYEGGPNEPAFVTLTPDAGFAETPYAFTSVDGGVIDNEPLELARRYLAGADLHNDQNGASANKAVVLIAPFPSLVKTPAADDNLKLVHVLKTLGSSLLQQARFKPDELHKAENDKVFSRFMISPTREHDPDNTLAAKLPIACGAMSGFSGFLHELFRRHDYLLGRRNAQAFLRWNFALPETNPLFEGVAINQERWRVKRADGRTGSIAAGADAALPDKTFAPRVDFGARPAGLSNHSLDRADAGAGGDRPRGLSHPRRGFARSRQATHRKARHGGDRNARRRRSRGLPVVDEFC